MARGRKVEPGVAPLPFGGPQNATDEAGAIPAPAQLGPLAQEKWRAMIGPLAARPGGLTAGDLDALAQYCVAYVNWLRVSAEMETAELLVCGRNQISYMNPLFNVMANLEASVIKNASRLGLDTAARVRAKIKETTKKSDAFAEFAKRSPGRRTLDDEENE